MTEEEEEDLICEICDEEVGTHSYMGNFIWISEWLCTGEKCVECNRKGCSSCIETCYSCGNIGENTFSICHDCLKSKELLKSTFKPLFGVNRTNLLIIFYC